jgi:hypothetical protein
MTPERAFHLFGDVLSNRDIRIFSRSDLAHGRVWFVHATVGDETREVFQSNDPRLAARWRETYTRLERNAQ